MLFKQYFIRKHCYFYMLINGEWRYFRYRLPCFFFSHVGKKPIRDKQHSSNHYINGLAADEGLRKSIRSHLNSYRSRRFL